MDIHVTVHAIKTDDENDGKVHCAVFTARTPPRVVHVEEAGSAKELQELVHVAMQRDDWTLATMTNTNPVRREELRERELNDAARDSFLELARVLEEAATAAISKLDGPLTHEQRIAIVKLVMTQLPDILAEAQKRSGRSETEVRAQLLRLAMQQKARAEKK